MRALWRALPCIRLIGTPIEPSQKVPLSPLRRPFLHKPKPPGTIGAELLQQFTACPHFSDAPRTAATARKTHI